MSRLIYADLLTESGFELLTESGDAIGLGVIGIAGDATVDGGIISALQSEAGLDLLTESGHVLTLARRNGGSAAGTGRITAATAVVIPKPFYAPSTTLVIPAQPALRGRVSAQGQAGTSGATGHLTLVGKAGVAGEPAGVWGQGQTTLVGKAAVKTWNHGYTKAQGQRALPGKASVGTWNHGYASGKGHLTLPGNIKVNAHNRGYVKATGYDEDEMAIVLLLLAA